MALVNQAFLRHVVHPKARGGTRANSSKFQQLLFGAKNRWSSRVYRSRIRHAGELDLLILAPSPTIQASAGEKIEIGRELISSEAGRRNEVRRWKIESRISRDFAGFVLTRDERENLIIRDIAPNGGGGGGCCELLCNWRERSLKLSLEKNRFASLGLCFFLLTPEISHLYSFISISFFLGLEKLENLDWTCKDVAKIFPADNNKWKGIIFEKNVIIIFSSLLRLNLLFISEISETKKKQKQAKTAFVISWNKTNPFASSKAIQFSN